MATVEDLGVRRECRDGLALMNPPPPPPPSSSIHCFDNVLNLFGLQLGRLCADRGRGRAQRARHAADAPGTAAWTLKFLLFPWQLSRISQPYATPHTPCDVFCSVAVLIGC